MPTCVVRNCNNDGLHEHHLWPKHLNGPEDGPTVWLCANCHQKIHVCASRLYRGVAVDEDALWLQGAAPIINRIVRAMREAEGMALDDAPARIILNVSKKELRQIHLRKMDRGFSSLEKYILMLIRADLPPVV